MQRHRLLKLSHLSRGVAGAIELACRERRPEHASRKQPALRLPHAPPVAQQFEQLWRQHHVAILAALALLDADHHALAVDVRGLERHHLGRAQASAISHAERRLVLEPRRRLQETRDLLRAQNDGKLVGLADERQMARDIGPAERHTEEKPQPGNGVVHAGRRDAV